jgi:hypothetical protein
MVAFTKYQDTVTKMWSAIHNLLAAGDVVKAVIHTDAPVVATDVGLSDWTQITGTGYTSGGNDTQNDVSGSGGTATWASVDITWTAGAGDWSSTARYVSQYNDTSTGDKALGSWDYGSTFALANGETFKLDFGASTGTLV